MDWVLRLNPFDYQRFMYYLNIISIKKIMFKFQEINHSPKYGSSNYLVISLLFQ